MFAQKLPDLKGHISWLQLNGASIHVVNCIPNNRHFFVLPLCRTRVKPRTAFHIVSAAIRAGLERNARGSNRNGDKQLRQQLNNFGMQPWSVCGAFSHPVAVESSAILERGNTEQPLLGKVPAAICLTKQKDWTIENLYPFFAVPLSSFERILLLFIHFCASMHPESTAARFFSF